MERQCNHKKKYYCVKRLRLLQHLVEHGFYEYSTIPDPGNRKYSWFVFVNTPELEECIEAYFAEIEARKQQQN